MASKFIWGLLVGGTAGAAYGLLTTPRTGKENQEMLKNYIDGTTYHVQDVADKVGNLQSAVETLTEEAKQFSTVFSKDIEQTITNFTYEAEPRLQRIQDRAETLAQDVEVASKNISGTLSDVK